MGHEVIEVEKSPGLDELTATCRLKIRIGDTDRSRDKEEMSKKDVNSGKSISTVLNGLMNGTGTYQIACRSKVVAPKWKGIIEKKGSCKYTERLLS